VLRSDVTLPFILASKSLVAASKREGALMRGEGASLAYVSYGVVNYHPPVENMK